MKTTHVSPHLGRVIFFCVTLFGLAFIVPWIWPVLSPDRTPTAEQVGNNIESAKRACFPGDTDPAFEAFCSAAFNAGPEGVFLRYDPQNVKRIYSVFSNTEHGVTRFFSDAENAAKTFGPSVLTTGFNTDAEILNYVGAYATVECDLIRQRQTGNAAFQNIEWHISNAIQQDCRQD